MSNFLSAITTWTALITPFKDNGEVDEEELIALAARQHAAGNGVLLFGSTGEGMSLSKEEKRRILNAVTQMSPRPALMVSVPGIESEGPIAWVKECNVYPIDAFLMVTPLYLRPGPEGQLDWFYRLLEASNHPCMLYNIPARAGCSLHLDVVKRLRAHSRFWAIKEASGSLEEWECYQEAVSDDVVLYSGCDTLIAEQMKRGGQGLVAVISNAFPEWTHELVVGSAEDFLGWKLATEVAGKCNPVSIKGVMHEMGMIASPKVRAPLKESDGSSVEAIQGILSVFSCANK